MVLSGTPAYLKRDGIQNIVNAALTLLKRFKVSQYSLQKKSINIILIKETYIIFFKQSVCEDFRS